MEKKQDDWEQIGSLVIQKSVYEKLQRVCSELGITIEEYIARSIMEATEEDFVEFAPLRQE